MFTRIAVATSVLLLSSVAVADHHESATPEDFALMGKLHVGRWVGDITFIADWPGESLGKGSKVVAYTEYKWAADKKMIERTQSLGNSQVKQIFFYDAPAKKIRFAWVSSNGACLFGHTWKKSDTSFAWRITGGGLADGTAETGDGETVFSTDLKTHTLKGNIKLAGEDLIPLKDVYKRLSPSE